MTQTKIEIRTEDGVCRSSVFKPDGKGPWPAVLMMMDGIGYRPALFEMGARLAKAGYYVVLPDLFYRAGEYAPPDPAKLFTDKALQTEWFKKFMAVASSDNIVRDTKAFLAHLDAQPDVRGPKLGVTGYCMGGRLALCVASSFPDRVVAVASYHGGNLATDAPDSPHKHAGAIKATVYVAAADNDPADQTQKLEAALAAAHVAHTVETYPAKHGWVPSDTPVHDAANTERHWKTLLELFGKTLA